MRHAAGSRETDGVAELYGLLPGPAIDGPSVHLKFPAPERRSRRVHLDATNAPTARSPDRSWLSCRVVTAEGDAQGRRGISRRRAPALVDARLEPTTSSLSHQQPRSLSGRRANDNAPQRYPCRLPLCPPLARRRGFSEPPKERASAPWILTLVPVATVQCSRGSRRPTKGRTRPHRRRSDVGVLREMARHSMPSSVRFRHLDTGHCLIACARPSVAVRCARLSYRAACSYAPRCPRSHGPGVVHTGYSLPAAVLT